MKQGLFFQILTGWAIAAGAIAIYTQPATAGSTFFCAQKQGIPRTFVRTRARGQVSVIRWQSPQSQGGFSPVQRCNIVSKRLQAHYENRTLKFIRTGSVGASPVLCVAREKSSACPRDGVLLTLKPGTDPNEVLNKLLNLRSLGSSREVYLSGSDLVSYAEGETYVNIDSFLKILEKEGGEGSDTGSEAD